MTQAARVLFENGAGAPHRIVLPIDRSSLPGETLTLANGRSIRVLAVTSDREHPEDVVVLACLVAPASIAPVFAVRSYRPSVRRRTGLTALARRRRRPLASGARRTDRASAEGS